MTTEVNLAILTFIVTLTFVSSSSLGRERRFLLDITDGAKDNVQQGNKDFPFSWDFGTGNFTLEDKEGAIQAISDAGNVSHSLLAWGFNLYDYAKVFRLHNTYYPNNKYMVKWEAAGEAVTNVLDATDILEDIIIDYNVELVVAMNNGSEAYELQAVFEKALSNIGSGIVRLENQITAAWSPLTTLRDSDKTIIEDVMNTLLTGFMQLENLLDLIKFCYQGLIEAAGIDD